MASSMRDGRLRPRRRRRAPRRRPGARALADRGRAFTRARDRARRPDAALDRANHPHPSAASPEPAPRPARGQLSPTSGPQSAVRLHARAPLTEQRCRRRGRVHAQIPPPSCAAADDPDRRRAPRRDGAVGEKHGTSVRIVESATQLFASCAASPRAQHRVIASQDTTGRRRGERAPDRGYHRECRSTICAIHRLLTSRADPAPRPIQVPEMIGSARQGRELEKQAPQRAGRRSVRHRRLDGKAAFAISRSTPGAARPWDRIRTARRPAVGCSGAPARAARL